MCRLHGGAAPQVQASAAARLAALVDPAIGAIGKALKSDNERVQLTAAQDVLNRNGLKAPERHEVTGKDGRPIEVQHSDAGLLKFATDKELEQWDAWKVALQARAAAAQGSPA